jgi:hypothetical protein
MNNFVSKLNLYELFAMLIPGSILLLELTMILDCQLYKCSCCTEPFEGMYIFVFFVLAYILGCVYHSFTDWWCNPFRNNPTHIAYVYHHDISQENKKALSKLFGDQNVEGCCFCSLLQCPCGLLRLAWMAVIVLFSPLSKICNCLCCKGSSSTNIEKSLFLDKYEMAYYYAERYRSGAPYSFIEGQIALCRNMILPVILVPYTLTGSFPVLGNCKGMFYLVAAILFVYVVFRQEKLYRCVFEDYEYTKRMEKYEKAE